MPSEQSCSARDRGRQLADGRSDQPIERALILVSTAQRPILSPRIPAHKIIERFADYGSVASAERDAPEHRLIVGHASTDPGSAAMTQPGTGPARA
jgi:hypothetical protein